MAPAAPQTPTACLALADGTVFYGQGFGATGQTVAELCFNTAMTGYQEIMTDPSYAGQVVTFTFPHIGNVGVNPDDDETGDPVAEGMVVKWDPTTPSNWRAAEELKTWLTRRGRIAIGGVDTRRLTRAIRQQGAPHVALAHDPSGQFDIAALVAAARGFAGLEGMDLARKVTCAQSYRWDEMRWAWPEGYTRQSDPKFKVVAVDYGAKRNILRCYDANTGKRIYQNRIPKMSMVAACPLVVGDQLFVVDEDGQGSLLAVGPEFKVMGSGKVEDTVWASPAITDDSIFIRGVDYLYCFRK